MATGDTHTSFCVLPWIHLFADEAGVMSPCCRTVSTGETNIDGDTGQARRVDHPGGILAGMNTPAMAALRVQMLAGDRPAACARCYMVEDVGIRSHRQDQNARWAKDIPAMLAATHVDGTADIVLKTADLRLGNVCNLRCRMCSPQSSRLLIPEFATYHDVPRGHAYFDRFRRIDWFEKPDFWAELERAAPSLESINLAGGEPFLIGQMFDFLERMIEIGAAGRMTISYNTNLTLIPERVKQLWPAFKAIRVTVSLDGHGAVNDYIRAPSRWPVIAENLRYLDTNADALNLRAGLATNTAVQLLNVFALEPLLAFLLSELTINDCPNLSIVTHPEHLDVRVLPPRLKAQAAAQLGDLARRVAAGWPHAAPRRDTTTLVAALTGIVDHMLAADHSHRLPEFLRWTQTMDDARGESLASAIPQLMPLLATSVAA
ncbi:twitch domain-containing radical SAM protein [Sphingomonas sp. 37zxx]|uniref:twitch domain-containing radical SAM protein n=1 Tax=Sphingomonas sp. 37zxx TaxID=1550073 RepID=UPI001E5C02F3|nr:twitch domain-containing radical SAM protein [Sphingomonas sp. 37zxx]